VLVVVGITKTEEQAWRSISASSARPAAAACTSGDGQKDAQEMGPGDGGDGLPIPD